MSFTDDQKLNYLVGYDCNGMIDIITKIIHTNTVEPDRDLLDELKGEFNKLNPSKSCKSVTYTHNNDKQFFGVIVQPVCYEDIIKKQIIGIEKVDPIDEYRVELDSKLFQILSLTSIDILSIILYNIGNIAFNDNILDDYGNIIDMYLANNHKYLDTEAFIKNAHMFLFSFHDTVIKEYSFFYRQVKEILLPYNLPNIIGFDNIQSVHEKISNVLSDQFKLYGNKLIILQWALDNYDIDGIEVDSIRKIKLYRDLSPSVLQKKIANYCMKSKGLPIDLEYSLQESSKYKNKLNNKGLRSMENELYELKIQVQANNDLDSCVYTLRLINNRIEIIDSFIEENGETLSKEQMKRWSDLFTEYDKLRKQISNKKIYKDKVYGLFTDYTKLSPEYLNMGYDDRY